MVESLYERHKKKWEAEAKLADEHWMPPIPPKYVLGCPYEIIEIDPEKEKDIWTGKK